LHHLSIYSALFFFFKYHNKINKKEDGKWEYDFVDETLTGERDV